MDIYLIMKLKIVNNYVEMVSFLKINVMIITPKMVMDVLLHVKSKRNINVLVVIKQINLYVHYQ